jgi:O-antigen/teichoic acid export membrane protein
MNISKKKIVFDLVLNMIATAVPIAILQLVIYPLISQDVTVEGYGMMVTVISLLTVISNTLGNTLNNIRLLNDGKYKKKRIVGDFNQLLLRESIISLIIVGSFSIVLFRQISLIEFLLIEVIGMLMVFHSYFIVDFRLKLDYNAIVWNNVQLALGYFVGYLTFFLTGIWELVYLFGYGFSLIYIFRKTKLWREPLLKTIYWHEILKDTFLLLISGVLGSLLNYSDKIIIYPMIGAEAVTIYYIATLLGKLVSMVIGPINSVMLSYIVKLKQISNKILTLILCSAVMIAVVGYIICLTFGEVVLKYIYPQHFSEVVKYMPITSATAMIMMLISVLYPFVLKFCKMKWQVIIDATSLICYVCLGVAFYQFYGLHGFCIGVLAAFLIKFFIMFIIFIKQKTVTSNV